MQEKSFNLDFEIILLTFVFLENMKNSNKKIEKTLPSIKKKLNRVDFKKNVNNRPTISSEYSKNWKAFLEEQARNNVGVKTKPRSTYKSKKKKESSTLENDTKNGIWFDDVDPILLEKECGVSMPTVTNKKNDENLTNEIVDSDPGSITKYIAIDCEMVGVGFKGKESVLARVSIVNSNGKCIYDKFVKPAEDVADYRTFVSGVRPEDLENAPSYQTVQKEVADILKGRILVGHALHNDLQVLYLSHPRKDIRDTQRYKPIQKLMKTKHPGLKKLAKVILKETIQTGEHSSVVDARVTMKIYKHFSKEWEQFVRLRKKKTSDKKIFVGDNVSDDSKKMKNKWKKTRRKH